MSSCWRSSFRCCMLRGPQPPPVCRCDWPSETAHLGVPPRRLQANLSSVPWLHPRCRRSGFRPSNAAANKVPRQGAPRTLHLILRQLRHRQNGREAARWRHPGIRALPWLPAWLQRGERQGFDTSRCRLNCTSMASVPTQVRDGPSIQPVTRTTELLSIWRQQALSSLRTARLPCPSRGSLRHGV